jgi:catechol 2,3-dioxygenase-like lactoylglutathione lyase family enzyme
MASHAFVVMPLLCASPLAWSHRLGESTTGTISHAAGFGDNAIACATPRQRGHLCRHAANAPAYRAGMLQHVTLEVRPGQVEACVRFWGLLGFEPMTPPPLLRDRFTWVARAGTQIHLVPVDEPVAAREGHVAVLAEDYDAALAALHEEGFATRPGTNAWDAPRSFVRDPAGHLVEVMSAPPQPPWPGEE